MKQVHDAASLIRGAKSVVVFTGAGISAESGIPTYRTGADGLWSRQNMERFANPTGYAANLPESYAWYLARARGVAGVEPNAGHRAIVELAELIPALTVITQNIDSLHQRAGSRDVIELHGHLREFRCDRCSKRLAWDAAPRDPAWGMGGHRESRPRGPAVPPSGDRHARVGRVGLAGDSRRGARNARVTLASGGAPPIFA